MSLLFAAAVSLSAPPMPTPIRLEAFAAAPAPQRAGPKPSSNQAGRRPAAARRDLAGTWDLVWQTRRGPSSAGYLEIRQKGEQLDVTIHGQGSLRASGAFVGDRFELRGNRLLVPFTMRGTLEGDRLIGVLKVLSVQRQFTAQRRSATAGGKQR